jgi:hypothetical protein
MHGVAAGRLLGGWYSMIDIAYVSATVAFFAIMLLYVRGCAVLGRDGTGEEEQR